jgi:hypothetical protein
MVRQIGNSCARQYSQRIRASARGKKETWPYHCNVCIVKQLDHQVPTRAKLYLLELGMDLQKRTTSYRRALRGYESTQSIFVNISC